MRPASRWRAGVALAGRDLARLLLPNACVACARAVERSTPDALVCAVCLTRLRAPPRGCARCAHPRPPVGPCRLCANWPPQLVAARSAVWLGDVAREMVHHLKYDGLQRLAGEIGRQTASRLSRPQPGVLVPVPLAAARASARGYNQAALIAHHLGRRWGLAVDDTSLWRTAGTASQTALTPAARLANVAGAFAARAPLRPRHGDAAILIDDVLTTGATLRAAAEALAAAGWTRVEAVTFARAMPADVRALQEPWI